MKCIRCDKDSKYKDRRDGMCSICRRPFAFEPKQGAKFTDAAFKSAIDAVSSGGRVRWGVEHLYYELCRRLTRKPGRGCLKPAIVLLSIGISGFFIPFVPLFFALPIGVIALMIAARAWAWTIPLTKDEFEKLWQRWLEAHGTPASVIERKPQKKKTGGENESDLGDYSFDRAVICDRARTVDLLLANNFHFENNCAVLSVSGYPPGPFELVRKMLKRNPRLQVFTLHDATPDGCRLARRLASEPEWFKDQAKVIDTGLRPGHARPFRGMLLAVATSVLPGNGIRSDEAKWLSKYSLELAAIRPEQVLKRLYKAMNLKAGEAERDDHLYFEDMVSFSIDADSSDSGPDSFG